LKDNKKINWVAFLTVLYREIKNFNGTAEKKAFEKGIHFRKK
jgi:hypothetical protein